MYGTATKKISNVISQVVKFLRWPVIGIMILILSSCGASKVTGSTGNNHTEPSYHLIISISQTSPDLSKIISILNEYGYIENIYTEDKGITSFTGTPIQVIKEDISSVKQINRIISELHHYSKDIFGIYE